MTDGQTIPTHLSLSDGQRRFGGLCLAGGLALLLLSILLTIPFGWEDVQQLFRSYHVAFITMLAISLGGLFFVFIQHLTRAGWSVPVRRIAETLAANLTWIWVALLPVLIMMAIDKGDVLFVWANKANVTGDHLLEHKAAYLDPIFWLIRAVVYLSIWALFGGFFWRHSVVQDHTGDIRLTHRMQRWAPICGLTFALTLTFAAFDWIMAIEAHWFSTIFGVYFFAASCCGSFALMIILLTWLKQGDKLRDEVSTEHFQDLGKLLFAFGVVFWAYIAFSQFMLYWYANIPETTGWYIVRSTGGWLWVSTLLILGHFVAPFLLLLSKHPKRQPKVLALVAAWMVLMLFVDVYWLALPHIPGHALESAGTFDAFRDMVASGEADTKFHPSIRDLTCLLGLGGVYLGMTIRRLGRAALMPLQDPRLSEGLAFENM
jgi:hypothetical protein